MALGWRKHSQRNCAPAVEFQSSWVEYAKWKGTVKDIQVVLRHPRLATTTDGTCCYLDLGTEITPHLQTRTA
jgi:hypothetical protein